MRRLMTALWLGLCAVSAQAELTVEITQGVEGGIPIAVVPFGGAQPVENLSAIVAADLARSGRFKILDEPHMPERPTSPEQVQFATWKGLGQDNLVIGHVQQDAAGRYTAQFQLFDTVRGAQLLAFNLPFEAAQARRAAHRIADLIHKQLTGDNGAFASRIAYITTAPGDGPQDLRYVLQVADTDGFNPQNIIKSREPLMSPAWSPDGKLIAYVSFENKRPAVYLQTLASSERQKLAEWPGINGAPAFSPDGKQLALTLSKDGNAEIYVLNLADGALRRLTDHFGIDTEPAWAKDSASLVFTSDRGGKPQLYQVAASGGQPKRITHEGDYNTSAVFAPDGKTLALVHGTAGSTRIAVLDLASGALRVLTPGPLDESPSFAPNGSLLLYAARVGEVAQLSAVAIDGKVRQRLRIDSGDVRGPAWSP